MNYVYYNIGKDGEKNWHGSPLYYEYPNVFADVLIHDYIGLDGDEEADVSVCPCLADFGSVTMESYGIKYEYSENSFKITNLRAETQRIRVDLSKLKGEYAFFGKEFENGTVVEVEGEKTTLFII